HFLGAGFIRAHRSIRRRRFEMRVEQRPERGLAVGARLLGHAVIDVAGFAFLGEQPRVLQQPEVSRDVGLCDAENPRQLRDVEAVLREHAEEAKPRRIREQAEEGRSLLHIYKSTYIDMTSSIRRAPVTVASAWLPRSRRLAGFATPENRPGRDRS